MNTQRVYAPENLLDQGDNSNDFGPTIVVNGFGAEHNMEEGILAAEQEALDEDAAGFAEDIGNINHAELHDHLQDLLNDIADGFIWMPQADMDTEDEGTDSE